MKKTNQGLKSHILVVEDDLNLREALVDTLEMAKMKVKSVSCAEQAVEVLKKDQGFDLIVSDVNMGAMSGHDLLRYVKKDYPHIPILLITAFASISESVQAMKEGAADYLVKPFDPQTFIETVEKFVGGFRPNNDEPIAIDKNSRELLTLAKRVAQSDSTALLIGESGTGKEVLARYIHDQSPRVNKPFIAINCAAIPENMLESILFGYEKGAFTGAYAATAGKFEQANGGTILLDEISEMDISLQAKLLRVLQEREVERLGGRKTITLDVRVIATSNRDMRKEVTLGKFREDLYFRLSVLPLQWAPLRDRPSDIVPIAVSLLRKHAQKQHRSKVALSPEAEKALTSYPWPGNVRELDNVMQRALILQVGNTISDVDLGLQIHQQFSQKPSLVDIDVYLTQEETVHYSTIGDRGTSEREHSPYIDEQTDKQIGQGTHSSSDDYSNDNLLHSTYGVKSLSESASANVDSLSMAPLGTDMRRHEFDIIVKTLKQEQGSKKNTAEKLGISPRTLRYKMARLRDAGFNLDLATHSI